jgi:spermidine synthase
MPSPTTPDRRLTYALFASVFVVAACGLIYELVAGALASYLLGDSVTQFSTIIGAYLFAMGIGSWLAQYVEQRLIDRFILIELVIALIGGFSAAILFIAFAYSAVPFRLLLYGLVFVIGTLVGMEIPLIMRILKDRLGFRELVSQVLSVDYLGALVVSVLFPLVFAPRLGMIRTALVFGLLNAVVAGLAIWLFRNHLAKPRWIGLQFVACTGLLLAGFIYADRLTQMAETQAYHDEIIFARSSPYQRIVVTRWRDDIRLHLNGNLQFSSRDEHRYHEALVHPALAALPAARKILILGGGDGLAAREVLKYPQVETVTLVDLDPEMTHLFKDNPALAALNGLALRSPKVTIVNADAFKWLEEDSGFYDLIIVDFPDPSNYAIGKLYSSAFYQILERRLAATGLAAIQSTSPIYARKSFWTVVTTIESVGLTTSPYFATVPSFGIWGFIIVSKRSYAPPALVPVSTRFVDGKTIPGLFAFPPDMARVPTEVNRLNNQVLVQTFEEEWRRAQKDR